MTLSRFFSLSKHHSPEVSFFVISYQPHNACFQILEIVAVGWHHAACNASIVPEKQSNCAVGGNPKFPEIKDCGCWLACGIELHVMQALSQKKTIKLCSRRCVQ